MELLIFPSCRYSGTRITILFNPLFMLYWILAVPSRISKREGFCEMHLGLDVSVENSDSSGSGGWTLVFNPPFAGIAHLSVTVDGSHIKNSPYVINVRTLALEPDTVNKLSKVKKNVKFDQISL